MLDKKIIPPEKVQGKSGVYILSPYTSPTVNKMKNVLVKIGKGKNLWKRLDDYHTCLPQSFWTFTLIITKDNKVADRLEKAFHSELKTKNYLYKHPDYNARIYGEWFQLRKGDLLKILNKTVSSPTFQEEIIDIVNPHPHYFNIKT